MVRNIGSRLGLALAVVLASSGAASAQSRLDAASANTVFERARLLCEADEGRTWGVSLCGPILIADPATRRVVANVDGLEKPLERTGAVFEGLLPDNVPIANTAVRWNGRAWTMLMAPLPDDETALSVLLMHEAWHRIQDQIGLAASNADQPQLATEAGRLSFRLELRALSAALTATDAQARRLAIRDALTFRAWRQAQFPQAQDAENIMERHEGLAEYTGRRLSRDDVMSQHLAEHLRRGDAVREYARTFAYYSGPAYGVLLDGAARDWRQTWDRHAGLPELLSQALALSVPFDDAAFELSAARYDGSTVRTEEAERAQAQAVRIAALRAKLVDGPVLATPASGANFNFDPNRVTPFPPEGSVYGLIRVAADWGVLDVERDGLLSADWSRLSVGYVDVAPTESGLKGEGWTLTLKPDWQLAPGRRDGDWTIIRRPISNP
ncbi:hypothetical protein [Brevundimonas nasdae]|uniref:hypothetical protein n=1 Tax=Brevundimonas nasdae TaxID=172043 RepID=UPI003F68BD63